MPERRADPAARLVEANAATLAYSRRRFLATWLALAALALLVAAALIATRENAATDLEQTDEIAVLASDTADAAKAQGDDTVSYLKGDSGIPGVPGENGVDGTPGLPSSEPGPQGERGVPGAPGPFGPIGPVGPQGPAGAAGTATTAGGQGAQGEQGPKGEKGDEGARGAEGPAGPAGAQGPPGVTPPLTTSITFAASANDTAAHKQVSTVCPSGRASGGGFATVPSDPGIIPQASSPVGNNGWNATADVLSLPPGTSWQLLVFVVCVS